MVQTPTSKLQPENRRQQPNKSLIQLIIAIAIIGLLGTGLGCYYSQLPEHNPQKNQSTCEQAGGEWLENQTTCLISNKVAGENCTDGGQCQSGVCFPPPLTPEQRASLSNGDVTDIIGTCYPEKLIEDCVKQVINGAVSLESLCYE